MRIGRSRIICTPGYPQWKFHSFLLRNILTFGSFGGCQKRHIISSQNSLTKKTSGNLFHTVYHYSPLQNLPAIVVNILPKTCWKKTKTLCEKFPRNLCGKNNTHYTAGAKISVTHKTQESGGGGWNQNEKLIPVLKIPSLLLHATIPWSIIFFFNSGDLKNTYLYRFFFKFWDDKNFFFYKNQQQYFGYLMI